MTKEARRLKYAIGLLEIWLDPLKIDCPAPAHKNDGRILGCTCRTNEIRGRTRDFLNGLRKTVRRGP